MGASTIQKGTIASQLGRELRRRIVHGEYASGTKLQQEQIAEEFGVSRGPVREALSQLEAEGLVQLISQKGATVSSVLESEVSELFELRVMIEPPLLSMAIKNMKEEDFQAVEAIIDEMSNINLARWGEANWRLHKALYKPANRPTILKQLERIHETIDRYLRMQITVTDGRPQADHEHRQILAACRAHHAELAAALLRSHILAAGSELEAIDKA